ncbi:MAG: TetR/AcrR family transcriptional regulator [Geminicoccales bacterium]
MEQRTYSAKATEILDAAERHMRSGGFDAVSFRDLAAEVGIKSASVHYHFPQKVDLGEAVVRRYTDRVMAVLAAPDDPSETITDRIERLCMVYRSAVLDDGKICLCCVLGAETLDLPEPVADAVGAYFKRLLGWVDMALGTAPDHAEDHKQRATQIVASLQGAMILALALKQQSLLTETADRILAQLPS